MLPEENQSLTIDLKKEILKADKQSHNQILQKV